MEESINDMLAADARSITQVTENTTDYSTVHQDRHFVSPEISGFFLNLFQVFFLHSASLCFILTPCPNVLYDENQ